MQRICICDTDSFTKSGKSTDSFTYLGRSYRFFAEIRRVKDRLRGPEFLSLKAASCLSKITQTWREKPANPLRLGVLFRQTAQTWRENQARSRLAPPAWRETRQLAVLSHEKPGIHTKWIPGFELIDPGISAIRDRTVPHRSFSTKLIETLSFLTLSPKRINYLMDLNYSFFV